MGSKGARCLELPTGSLLGQYDMMAYNGADDQNSWRLVPNRAPRSINGFWRPDGSALPAN